MSKMVTLPSYTRRIIELIPVDFRQTIGNVTCLFLNLVC